MNGNNRATPPKIHPQQNTTNQVFFQQGIRFKYRPSLFSKYTECEIKPIIYPPKQMTNNKSESRKQQQADDKSRHVIRSDEKVVTKRRTTLLKSHVSTEDEAEDICRLDVESDVETDRTNSPGSPRNRLTSRRKSSARKRLQQRRGSFIPENDEELMHVYEEETDNQTEEDILENIQEQKELIDNVKFQPWRISKKLKILRLARAYVGHHEGRLSRGKSYQQRGMQAFRQLKRNIDNFISMLVPWEMKIKRIESHFGSVVASYFVFLRWLIWINIWLTLIPVCFVIIPELIVGQPYGSSDRKSVPKDEADSSADIKTMWDAEGVLKYSVVFYGYYGNEELAGTGYRKPLAYLVSSLAAFAFSFVVVLKTMAGNSRQSRMSTKDENFTFSWKIFTDWDYMIGNRETATTKHASLVTTFREAILEEQEKKKEENRKLLIFLRILANVLVLMLLALSTYIIQVFVDRSRKMEELKLRDSNYVAGFWAENELTIIMTLISTIFPNISDLISIMEKYHPRTNLRLQLARIFALNLLNLYTLFIALYNKQQDLKAEISKQMNVTMNVTCSTSVSTSTIPPSLVTAVDSSVTSENSTQNCTSQPSTAAELCWETMIGQEVWKLTIMDTIFVVGQIIIIDLIRSVFIRYCNNLCCWDMEKKFPEYPDFKTAENLLHLINNQGVIWLGTFFAPGLPVLNFVKLLLLVYVRCWSVMACNVPQERIFRASRSNNFYIALLLVMLFLCMLPPLFAIVAVDPSPNCGPFSGRNKIFYVITDTMETELPEWVNNALVYAASPGVIIPVFLLLAMTIYYLVSVGRSLRDANTELRMQLEYERTEGRRKVYAMADAKRELEASKHKVLPDVPPKPKGRKNLSQAASSVMAVARMAKMLSGDVKTPSSIAAKNAQIPVAVVTGKRSLKGNNPALKESDKIYNQENKMHLYKAASKVTKRLQGKGKTNGLLLSSASADHVNNVRRSVGSTKVTEEPPEGNRKLNPINYTESSDDGDTAPRRAPGESRRGSAPGESRTAVPISGDNRRVAIRSRPVVESDDSKSVYSPADSSRRFPVSGDSRRVPSRTRPVESLDDSKPNHAPGDNRRVFSRTRPTTIESDENKISRIPDDNRRVSSRTRSVIESDDSKTVCSPGDNRNITTPTTRPVVESNNRETVPAALIYVESFDEGRQITASIKDVEASDEARKVSVPLKYDESSQGGEKVTDSNKHLESLDDAETVHSPAKPNRPRVPPKTFPKKTNYSKISSMKPETIAIPTSVQIVNEISNTSVTSSRTDDVESAPTTTTSVAFTVRSAIPKIRVVDYSDDNHSVGSDKEIELHAYDNEAFEPHADDALLLHAPSPELDEVEDSQESDVTSRDKVQSPYADEADVDSVTSDELNTSKDTFSSSKDTFSSTLAEFQRNSEIVQESAHTFRRANYFTSARAVFEK